MLNNNYSFNSPGKKNPLNNLQESILTDDKFIGLINNLSELIKKYYYLFKNNNEEIFQSFNLYESNYNFLISLIKNLLHSPNDGFEEFLEIEENSKNITTHFYSNLEKKKKNLKLFIEEAKGIFKKMK